MADLYLLGFVGFGCFYGLYLLEYRNLEFTEVVLKAVMMGLIWPAVCVLWVFFAIESILKQGELKNDK